MEKDIDLVLTYVNPSDFVWRKAAQDAMSEKTELTMAADKNYRDWDFLRYWFRGAAECMPYIRKIYIVVSNDEQIPIWLNQDKVNVVLHKDIMPSGYLPCFNSVTIEFFLYNIPDLAEQFVYANDDMFCINYIDPSLLFDSGKACIRMLSCEIDKIGNSDNWLKTLKRSNDMVFKKFGRPANLSNNRILVHEHGPIALLRSQLNDVWGAYKKDILESLSRTRDSNRDLSPVVYTLHQLLSGKCVTKYPVFAYVDGKSNFNWLRITEDKELQYLCINDNQWSDFGFEWAKRTAKELLERRFPEKCIYEK